MNTGTQVRITGTRRNADGTAVPYGYVATVIGTHAPTGRLTVEAWDGRRTVRIGETVEVEGDPQAEPCDACNAEPGEPCNVGCIGLAAHEDEHAEDCGYCQAGEGMRHNYEPQQ